jgi:negative regulator of sigma E activity
MNGCDPIKASFTEYLDGRLTGREMQRIAGHLDHCRECAGEWRSLRQVQAALAGLAPVEEPPDLLLKIRVALSQERARRVRGPFEGWSLVWRNSLGPFLLQASAGLASAMLLLGTVTVLVTMFAQPQRVIAQPDEPLGNATAPRFLFSLTDQQSSEIGDASGPVVVEAYVNKTGRVYDFRIVSGANDEATRVQVENLLVGSYFKPASFFGQPVSGLAVLSFAGVSVRG